MPPDPFGGNRLPEEMWAEQVCLDAQELSRELVDTPKLPLLSVAIYMRGITGLVNELYREGSFDAYRLKPFRLPEGTLEAIDGIVTVGNTYLASIGLEGAPQEEDNEHRAHVANTSFLAPLDQDEVEVEDPGRVSNQLREARLVVNYLIKHVSQVGDLDYRAQRSRGTLAKERLSNIRHDEAGIREVIRQYGESFAPLALAWVEASRSVGHNPRSPYSALSQAEADIAKASEQLTSPSPIEW